MDLMAPPDSEADARIVIDGALRAAGWDPADKGQVRTEVHVAQAYTQPAGGVASSGERGAAAGSSFASDAVPAGAEAATRRADYVLYDQSGRPLAVIEAKKNAIHPYVAKQQALPYAQNIGAPF